MRTSKRILLKLKCTLKWAKLESDSSIASAVMTFYRRLSPAINGWGTNLSDNNTFQIVTFFSVKTLKSISNLLRCSTVLSFPMPVAHLTLFIRGWGGGGGGENREVEAHSPQRKREHFKSIVTRMWWLTLSWQLRSGRVYRQRWINK